MTVLVAMTPQRQFNVSVFASTTVSVSKRKSAANVQQVLRVNTNRGQRDDVCHLDLSLDELQAKTEIFSLRFLPSALRNDPALAALPSLISAVYH